MADTHICTPRFPPPPFFFFLLLLFSLVFSRFFGVFLGKLQNHLEKTKKTIWWGTFLAYTHICTPIFFSRGFLGFWEKCEKPRENNKTPKKQSCGGHCWHTPISAPRWFFLVFVCFFGFSRGLFWFSTTSVGCQCYLLFSSAFVLFAVYDEGWRRCHVEGAMGAVCSN